MNIRRAWAMPSPNTFDIPPIAQFISRYLRGVSVDPFSRNGTLATWRNDLDPTTAAAHHMEATAFLRMLLDQGVRANTLLIDPPYSPRQIAECYKVAGKIAGMEDTQSGRLLRECRDLMRELAAPGAVALSFGWNSTGMGAEWPIAEILLVCHGGAHNDTICVAQVNAQGRLFEIEAAADYARARGIEE